MSELRIAHTAELDAETLSTARTLLVDAFEGDFGDEDWEHSLGGMHALVWEGSELIGHASVVQRRLLHDGRALRTGYVEGVGVRSDRRRQGYAGAMMTALERVIRDAYSLGALSASEDAAGLYASRGWQLWQGPTSTLGVKGIEPTPDDDGGVYVLPCSLELDLTTELTCDYRTGDVW